MADQAVVEDDIFVYMGGQAPQHVINAIIDESVTEIDEHAFGRCRQLQSVRFHDGVSRVKRWAFCLCDQLRQVDMPGVEHIETYAFVTCLSLRNVTMPSVRILEESAFHGCQSIEVLDLPKLELTSFRTFEGCRSLRQVTMPSIKTIGGGTFFGCEQLVELDLPKDVETIGTNAAIRCTNLRRIAIPLKSDMLSSVVYDSQGNIAREHDSSNVRKYGQFNHCDRLSTVDLVGGIHKTISSLLLERWKDIMKREIHRINLILPNDTGDKGFAIQRWIESLIRRMEYYKVGHQKLLKEATHLLELALWKINLDDNEDDDDTRTRNELRFTSGASIVVKNVLPFLRLDE